MKRLSLAIGIVALTVGFGTPAAAVEIQNFKSGLSCIAQQSDDARQSLTGWICFETDTIFITGQGQCVFNGEKQRCTWYGFEFDYTHAREEDEIICTIKSSQKGNYGNPDNLITESSGTYNYKLELEPGSGHFYNPQYSVLSFSKDGPKVIHEKTVCRTGDEVLFQFENWLNYPRF